MSRLDVRKLLIGIAVLMIVFGILGSIVYPGGGALRAFDLNKEQTFPATFSGLLLLGAGALALLNGVVRCPNPARPPCGGWCLQGFSRFWASTR